MQLVSREVLFDVMRNKNDIHLTESDNSSNAFQVFCKKATTEYDNTHSMSDFSEAMLDFMRDNVDAIRFVGQGSSRICFAMADGTALKLAKTEAGIAQNKQEIKTCMNPLMKYAIFPDFYAADTNKYLTLNCELCTNAKEEDFKRLFKCQPSAIANIIEFIIKTKMEDYQLKQLIDYYTKLDMIIYANFVDKLINDNSQRFNAIRSLIDFYRRNGLDELLLGDVEEVENWGLAIRDNEQTLIIIDAGFSEQVHQRYYKRKSRTF